MGFLDWVLGRKDRAVSATRPAQAETPPSSPAPPIGANGVDRREINPPRPEERPAPPSEADNLKRWHEGGQPRAWVVAHNGRWNHDDWLALLDDLKRSSFWPLQPDEVGRVLEEEKAKWAKAK